MVSDVVVEALVYIMRSAAWLPSGERTQSKIRPTQMNGFVRRFNCVRIVLLNVRLPISCSSSPTFEPRSNFQEAILYIVRPTIIEKIMGNSVAACRCQLSTKALENRHTTLVQLSSTFSK